MPNRWWNRWIAPRGGVARAERKRVLLPMVAVACCLAQLPACLGDNNKLCTGATGTLAQHYHPCEPAKKNEACLVRCGDGYKCTKNCPDGTRQSETVFTCTKKNKAFAWQATTTSRKQMVCEPEEPCASLAMPPLDSNAHWQPGSSCAEVVADARAKAGDDADNETLAKALAGVKEAEGTECAAVCDPGYYRVGFNGTSGDPDATSGPTVTVTCVDGTWTSPLDHVHNGMYMSLEANAKSKKHKDKDKRGPCVKDKECSTQQQPDPNAEWYEKSECAKLHALQTPARPNSVCGTVCRNGFYRPTTGAILNLTCTHGHWIGDGGECVAGNAYNPSPPLPPSETSADDGQEAGAVATMRELLGMAVFALALIKLGCLCQKRQDKNMLFTASQMHTAMVRPPLDDDTREHSVSGADSFTNASD